MQEKEDGQIPSVYIEADSVPSAYYRLLSAVHKNGYPLRTQYDRKNPDGTYLDPPGRDAKAYVRINNPFAQPRFPPISYCEIGKYIAEILGAKDHLVVPFDELKKIIKENKELSAMKWPYCYHQRLAAYPCSDGTTINQLDSIIEKLGKDPISRRAVAITSVPEIDLPLKEDAPCLRELRLRLIKDKHGRLVLNSHTTWRSRDLYKAWGDNVIGLTNLVQIEIVPALEKKLEEKIIMGPYTEDVSSLHIYGQDYTQKHADKLFKTFPTEESFLGRSMTSEDAMDALVVPQLEELRKEDTWKFTPESLKIIDNLIAGYNSGTFLP